MLVSLHVKNLALIGEEEIEFQKGLNILSGETGAGKSIILGALQLALGAKVPKGFLRDPETEALVEAVFSVDENEKTLLSQIEVDATDGEVIMTRRISPTRAASKINGESVTASKLKEVGEILIDIYGQHDYQSLLQKSSHMKLLDNYTGKEGADALEAVSKCYFQYKELLSKHSEADLDEIERNRRLDLLRHEISEIEAAGLKAGEDETLEEDYRRLSNAQKISTAIGSAITATDSDAIDSISRAIRELRDIESFDEEISQITQTLIDTEDILSDAHRRLIDYERNNEYSEQALFETTSRLDVINRLKEKYARDTDSIEGVLSSLENKITEAERLESFEDYLKDLKVKLNDSQKALISASQDLSEIRKKYAFRLTGEIREALLDLNFMGVEFEIKINSIDEYSSNGMDEVCFMISTNPGEAIKPLYEVASGGELSRIMLAIKTVWAFEGGIDTLIFDEIDAGISGRTAAAVAKKLREVSNSHQVICITHLPQIAAMADTHFLIEKGVSDDRTISKISPLDEEKSIEEIARMLGTETITQATLMNAKELKEQAKK